MATVLVIGSGMIGLSTAILLARDGHAVTVLERDPDPVPEDPWQNWRRPGVAQFHMIHFTLPRWYREMTDVLPDVLDELRTLGATRFNWMVGLPEDRRGPLRPGDEAFETLTARRPVLEAALARVAARTNGLRVHRGVTVAGLSTSSVPGFDVPRVTGLHLATGERLSADIVVDCSGRHSEVGRWLGQAGAGPLPESREADAYVYYCRHYRTDHGTLPQLRTTVLRHHDSVSLVTLPADRGTWSVAFCGWSGDRALRALRDPDRFEAALARYPLLAQWGAGGRGVQPITGVAAMGGLRNSGRRVVVDGEPVALGLALVGDASSFTNPASGRGMALGLIQARALQEVLRETDATDAAKVTLRFEERESETVRPLVEGTRAFDSHRLAEIKSDVAGHPYETDDPSWKLVKALIAGADLDWDLLRRYSTLGALHASADDVLSAPGLAERVLALGGSAAQYPPSGPPRRELLRTLEQ